jgi:ribosomal protein S11
MTKLVKKISLHKGRHKIPKGVFHIQASFNNTIITVIDIRGQVMF